jgi:hypothetical protein
MNTNINNPWYEYYIQTHIPLLPLYNVFTYYENTFTIIIHNIEPVNVRGIETAVEHEIWDIENQIS